MARPKKKPEGLGYSDKLHNLPELIENIHTVAI